VNAGDTLKAVQQVGASIDSHLWMVISDPAVDAEHVVIVNFTSWRQDKDQACIVEPSEHPFLHHRSCVNFAGAKTVRAADLNLLVQRGQLTPHVPLSPSLLDKIRESVPASRMPLDAANRLSDQGLIEL
jgi:hypothetical protein